MYQMQDRFRVGDHVFSIVLYFLSRFTSDTIGCRTRDRLKSNVHQAASKVTTVVQFLPNVMDKVVGTEERNNHFRDKLLEAWIAANIPLDELLIPKLRAFLQRLISSGKLDVKVPNPRTLRRNTMKLFSQKRGEIRKRIRGKDVYLLIDETTDAESRNMRRSLILNDYFIDYICKNFNIDNTDHTEEVHRYRALMVDNQQLALHGLAVHTIHLKR